MMHCSPAISLHEEVSPHLHTREWKMMMMRTYDLANVDAPSMSLQPPAIPLHRESQSFCRA